MSAADDTYDTVIIGSGQGGKPLAQALAAAGRRTALVEREHVGGTCINVGCTPTKVMVASARVAYLARRAADFGITHSGIAVDQRVVRSRKRTIVESWRAGSQKRLERTDNLALIFGEARLASAREVLVATRDGGDARLRAERVVINTGCRPARPPLPGLDSVSWFDSTTIMELDVVPEHLVVLGGGYIGLEFAQMFRRLGSKLTLVQRGPQLAEREDPDIAAAVAEVLREDGVEVLLGHEALRVEPRGAGLALSLRHDGTESTVEGTHLLVATGRKPNTEALGLAEVGVAVDARGYIITNEALETNVPGVFAIGDVKGGPAFTHISYDDFRVLRTNLLGDGGATITGRQVPWVVFIDPELARVGLNETEARASGRKVRVAKMPMSHVARALEMDEARGLMKVVVDEGTGKILGFAVLGVSGGELMSVVQTAMLGGLHHRALRDAIFAHPTLAESLNNLFGELDATTTSC